MPDDPKTCRTCGIALPAGTLRGMCPRCLLKAGLEAVGGRHLHVRCPNCLHAIEIVDDTPVKDVVCPACDTGFSLVGDETRTYVPTEPATLGRFELLDRLGVGSFGSVWKARDPELDRFVAVKVPRKGQLTTDEVEKFLREARSAAQLRHPNIVAVHEVGRAGDSVFIVSELVNGVTLADQLTTDRPEVADAARICETIARALHHAHSAGVVHRDLKPSNIMLDAAGEPHVMDFGLAKRSAGEISMTLDGQVLGTPAYMSPEQAKGEGHNADARSDVYSLGVVLFELLTGEKPFRGSIRMLLHQVIHDDPPSPRRLNSRVPRDLETIVLKCLEKDPRRRYGSADELADDLRRARLGEPIQARPVTKVERLWRWCRRNPLPASLATALVVAILVGFASVTLALFAANQQRALAQTNADRARRRADESRSRLVRQYVSEGSRAAHDGDPLRAEVWFSEAFRQDAAQVAILGDAHDTIGLTSQNDAATSRRLEMHRRRLGTLHRQRPRLVHAVFRKSEIDGARFSPNGRRVVLHHGETLETIDAESGLVVGEPLHLTGTIWNIVFSSDGRRVAAFAMPPNLPAGGKYDGMVSVLDTESARPVFPTKSFRALDPWHAKFSPDGRRLLVIAGSDLHILDAATGAPALTPIQHTAEITGLAISSDGRRAVVWVHVYESQSEVWLYDMETGRQVGSMIRDEQFDPSDRAISPDGRIFATFKYDYTGGRGSGPSTLRLWSTESGEPMSSPLATAINVEHTTYSLDGSFVFARLRDGQIQAWNVETGELEPLHAKLTDRIEQFAFSPDGGRIAVSEYDLGRSSITVFNAPTRTGWILFSREFGGRVEQIEFSPDGQRMLITAAERSARRGDIHVVDLDSRDVATVSVEHQYGSLRAEFSPDGQRLLTFGEDGAARVWDVTRLGPTLRTIDELNDRGVSCLKLSKSGRRLAIGQGHYDLAVERGGGESFGLLRVWDLETGQPIGPEVKFDSRVTQIHFDSAEQSALVTLSHGSAALIDITSGRVLRQIKSAENELVQATALRNDNRITTYIARNTNEPGYWEHEGVRVETWLRGDSATAVLENTVKLESHELLVLAPAGDRFLFVAPDRTASIRDTTTGLPVTKLGVLHGIPEWGVFSPDSERLAIVFSDRLSEIRDTRTGMLAAPLLRDIENVRFDSGVHDKAPIRFSEDGRLLLARVDEFRSQVFDATTSEPLSLPFCTNRLIRSPYYELLPVFGPEGDTFISTAGQSLRIWNIAAESIGAEECVVWSEVVDGHRIDTIGGYAASDVATLAANWNSHSSNRPLAELQPTASDVLAWHEREALLQEAVAEDGPHDSPTDIGHWFAAKSHLDHLIAAKPNDVHLRRRRGHAIVEMLDGIGRQAAASATFRDLASQPTFVPAIAGRDSRMSTHNLSASAVDDLTLAIDGGLERDAASWFDRGIARRLRAAEGDTDASHADAAHAVELGFEYSRRELSHWQQRAVAEGLTRSIAREPANLDLVKRRAQLFWEMDEWQRGTADFTQLIEKDTTNLWNYYRRGDCHTGTGRWNEAIADYTAALAGKLDDPDILEMRAGALALAGRFDEATSDLVRARELHSYPFDLLLDEVLVRLLASDEVGYKKVCAEMLDRARNLYASDKFPASVPPETATTIAWACSLAPGSISDSDQIVSLAKRGAETRWHDDSNGYISLKSLGAALLRAGRDAEVVETLSAAGEQFEDAVEVWLLLALAHRRLGHIDDSQRWLARANSAMDAKPIRLPWPETAWLRILRRETADK